MKENDQDLEKLTVFLLLNIFFKIWQVQFDGTVKASCSLNSDMISSCAGARQHPGDMCNDQLRRSLCMF